MKTDDLVAMLAREAEPVHRDGTRRLAWALGAGAAVSGLLMVALLGVRADLAYAAQLPMFWVKIAFPALLCVGALYLVGRVARPGAGLQAAPAGIALPIAVMMALAALALVFAPPGERVALILGATWKSCPFNIAVLSLPVLAAAVWWMRSRAPTRLRLAGAACGAVAGAIAALIYALHCPELAPPFIATWYVLGMSIPVACGALLAPTLRW